MYIVIKFGSLSGLSRVIGIVKQGSIIDITLMYSYSIFCFISLALVITSIVFDSIKKRRVFENTHR